MLRSHARAPQVPGLWVTGDPPAPPSLSPASPHPLAPRPAPISPAAPVCGDAPDTSGSRPPGHPPRTGSGSARVPAARPPLTACFREPGWLVAAAMIASSRDGGAARKPRPIAAPRPGAEETVGQGMLERGAATADSIGSSCWLVPAGSSGMTEYFLFSTRYLRKTPTVPRLLMNSAALN